MIRVGKLSKKRHRITIQENQHSGQTDNYGAVIDNWQDIAIAWASKESLRAREFFQAAGTNFEETVQFVIRYKKGIEKGMRVVHDNRCYEIYNVDDVDGYHNEIILMTKEITRDAG